MQKILQYLFRPQNTLDFLSKKHVKFDQGLDFLNFCQGNRGKNQEKPRTNHEKIRKNEENLKNPGPYFLLNIFLLYTIFSKLTLFYHYHRQWQNHLLLQHLKRSVYYHPQEHWWLQYHYHHYH